LASVKTISASAKLLPVQDFEYLRENGLKYIQQLSGKLWTDHNLHDPGITIMEVLCYALMDLGYRSAFPVQDIITESDGTPVQNAFHTAANIFTTNAVTVNDYRKLLIDIPGIRNAWLFTKNADGNVFDEGVKLFAHCKESELIYESEIATKIPIPAEQEHALTQEQVYIKGLYAVKLELDEHPLYGDMNSSVVTMKITKGDLTGYHLEITFPAWDSTDKSGKELITLFSAPKIDSVKVELIKDANLDDQKFKELLRSAWNTNWTLKYGTETRILDNVKVKVLKAPIENQGLVKGQLLLAELNTSTANEIIRRFVQRPVAMFAIFDQVRSTLMANRNLAEDFLYDIRIIDTEDLAICIDVDVDTNADLETIQAQIFKVVENYLLPPVRFSTLPELLKSGTPVEEIFSGPVLQHGFLTDKTIQEADLKSEYYISDIISLIMDIPGVQNIRNFNFSISENGTLKNQPDAWRIKITPNHKLRLARDKCKILFLKNGLPLTARFWESINKLRLLNNLQNFRKQKNVSGDLPVPSGKFRNLDKHYSILTEFPRVYLLNENKDDLAKTFSPERLAQVKQLEAYLTFFDQLIANYFSQLNQVKSLLSWNDCKNTYQSQFFYDDISASVLFNDVEYLREGGGMQTIAESKSVFRDRRNRILDHLIARFAENFNDYAIHMYALPDELTISDEEVSDKLITDKIKLLQNYPSISKGRSGAYNYSLSDADPVNTSNISGYGKRMRSLLGMDIEKTQSLKGLAANDQQGGFHLLEHLLLRPQKDGDQLLSVCLDSNCDHCGDEDPYSFKISIILPYWLNRFKNIPFRNYMETLFRSEAPAHIILKICWVDKKEMENFEAAYADWIIQKAQYVENLPSPSASQQKKYSDSLAKLIIVLEALRTDFPAATLHDCEDRDEANENRVFLGQTVLGTFNPTQSDDV
jgi:hypothetical protein